MSSHNTMNSNEGVHMRRVIESPDPNAHLMERILSRENMQRAWKRVKANKGAPGVDNISIDEFPGFAREHWNAIRESLSDGSYQPLPVKRVEIPKQSGGTRPLGIPTVTDRLIQQAISQILTPIFDPEFSDFSYGFRPGRSAHDAVLFLWHANHRIALDLDGTVLGHLAVLDIRPMPEEPRAHAIIRIFAARAAAEVRRLRAEAQIRDREEKLGRLVNSAMDGIIEFDEHLNITRTNPAAEKVFHCSESAMAGRGLLEFFSEENRAAIAGLIEKLDALPEGERSLWIPGQLIAFRHDGSAFPAEATLSRYEMGRKQYHTLILRDVKERIHAEQTIRSLTVETEYLREEIKELNHHDTIVGNSKALRSVLDDIHQVAGADTTVLILGETGTGKELVARAIHDAQPAHDKPLIKVNCAAIPASLMESEFFGHEKGAFTGATAETRRALCPRRRRDHLSR